MRSAVFLKIEILSFVETGFHPKSISFWSDSRSVQRARLPVISNHLSNIVFPIIRGCFETFAPRGLFWRQKKEHKICSVKRERDVNTGLFLITTTAKHIVTKF
jgi:hypothetical protein